MAACRGPAGPGKTPRRRQRRQGFATIAPCPDEPATMKFRPHTARAPAALMREKASLRALLDAAQRLARLQALLDEQLPPAARPHCRIASWREGALLLVISDSHWATRLRYQQRRLLKQLQAYREFAGLQRVLFKVRPPHTGGAAPQRSARLSPSAAQSVQASAESVSDPRLRAALERLASRARREE